MVFRILSPLAFDNQVRLFPCPAHFRTFLLANPSCSSLPLHRIQSDPTLSALTQTYNRLLPSLSTYPTSLSPSSPSFQPNGSPLSSDDPLLTPEGLLSSSSRPSRPRNERILTGLEELKRLERKAKEGRAYAGMLGEAVQGRVSEGGEAREVEGDEMVQVRFPFFPFSLSPSPLLLPHSSPVYLSKPRLTICKRARPRAQEFYAQALAAQDLLSSNLDWASVQAEQSRICALEAAGMPVSEGAGEGPEQTEEERVLEVLLGASSEVRFLLLFLLFPLYCFPLLTSTPSSFITISSHRSPKPLPSTPVSSLPSPTPPTPPPPHTASP